MASKGKVLIIVVEEGDSLYHLAGLAVNLCKDMRVDTVMFTINETLIEVSHGDSIEDVIEQHYSKTFVHKN